MEHRILLEYTLLLASKSPRRRNLLTDLGLNFQTVEIEVDEVYPETLQAADIALYLCELKANALPAEKIPAKNILITADTIVWVNGKCIGKPANREEAIEMLQTLSGRQHSVYTGVCLKSATRQHAFHSHTRVTFDTLDINDILYYVDTYKPFDKAGAYGIQEWIGLAGVKSVEGCFYNVMGFPVQRFYRELKEFVSQ